MSTFILPPQPPLQTGELFPPCNFEYLDASIRAYVKDAYDVMSRNELWRPFREALLSRGVDHNTGFMFTDDPLYRTIQIHIASTYIGSGHSGFTMGYTMREIEFIALKGEPAYRLRVEQQNCSSIFTATTTAATATTEVTATTATATTSVTALPPRQ